VEERSDLPLNEREQELWRDRRHISPEEQAAIANSREAMIIESGEHDYGDGHVTKTTTLITTSHVTHPSPPTSSVGESASVRAESEPAELEIVDIVEERRQSVQRESPISSDSVIVRDEEDLPERDSQHEATPVARHHEQPEESEVEPPAESPSRRTPSGGGYEAEEESAEGRSS